MAVHGGPKPSGSLVEVKPVEDLKKDWRTLKPRLKAGRQFAHDHGLRFELLTERQLHCWPLNAYRFLSRFRSVPRDESIEEHLVHCLATIGPSVPRKLLAAAFITTENQQRAIPYMWKLVATGRIMAGVDEGPLEMATTPLWIDRDSDWRKYDPYSRKHLMRMGDDQ